MRTRSLCRPGCAPTAASPAVGRSPRAADFSRQLRWLAAKVRREQAQLDAAITRFAGRAPRLSELVTLDGAEFELLLDLLDAALTASRGSDGIRTTRTGGREAAHRAAPAW